MKATNKRRIPNSLQNILILFLLASALFLFLHTGLLRGDLLSGVSQGNIYLSGSQSALSMELPVHIAVRSGGECRAWSSETTAGEVFEDLGSPLTEAIGSAAGSTSVSEDEFRRVLENDCLYFDFTASLPLSLLAQWLGVEHASSQICARALLLTGLQDSTAVLYSWDSEQNRFYRWSTSVPSDALFSTVEKHSGSTSEFAFLSDAPYDSLSPHTLLCYDRISLLSLNSSTLFRTAEDEPLLFQLEFQLYTQYTEASGTTVFTQGSRTLRFFPDGTVVYNGEAEGLPLLSVSAQGEYATAAEHMDAAQTAAETLFSGRIGDAVLYPLSVSCDESGNAEVCFGYMVNGYPIVFQNSPAVRMIIEQHTITNITLHLRSYTLSTTGTALMPVLQAAAAVQNGAPRELFPGYLDDGSELLSPCWLQK